MRVSAGEVRSFDAESDFQQNVALRLEANFIDDANFPDRSLRTSHPKTKRKRPRLG